MDYIKIEDCCEILDSQRVPITGKDRVAGEYPYYGANGVQGYVNEYIFDDDLVLVAEDGGYFGSKTKPIAYKVSGKCWVNNHAHVLKAKESVDTDYLCYSLMFYNVDKIVNGATRQKLNQKQLRQMLVPKRTKSKQLEIVRQLKTIERIIENKGAQLTDYDQLIKSRFVEMFGDPILNQKGWNSEKLQNVCPVNKYKGEVENISGKVWLLNLDMIESNTGKIIDYVYEDENIIASSTIKFDTNCVLYSKLRPYLNKVVVPSKTGYATSEMISMKTDNINKYFLSNLLMMNSFVDFANGTSYGAKMPRASVDMIKNFDLMLPPKSLQDDFGLFVEQVDKLKFEDDFYQ